VASKSGNRAEAQEKTRLTTAIEMAWLAAGYVSVTRQEVLTLSCMALGISVDF
jgi:hypothetical protein